MIRPELMELLRCPLDGRSRLEEADGALVCQRCRLAYPVRDGIACLIPEEAQLPDGAERLDALPCRAKK
ncbi:MAG: Trm112 family protein [Gemmataceae bacterium]